MYYKRLSVEQLKHLKYPNLMAELIESRYSICTVADHMGLGRRKEDDSEVWGKIQGNIEITCKEAVGLARLFGVKFEYLFSDELILFGSDPIAVVRWAEENKRRDQESLDNKVIFEAYEKLRKNRVFLETIKPILKLSNDELKSLMMMLEGGKWHDKA